MCFFGKGRRIGLSPAGVAFIAIANFLFSSKDWDLPSSSPYQFIMPMWRDHFCPVAAFN